MQLPCPPSFAQQSYLSCLSLDESSSRTSSHGIIFAFPESISAIRREISSSQAFSAPSSTVLSRLASRESASAALSSSERESAFRSRSRACSVMKQLCRCDAVSDQDSSRDQSRRPSFILSRAAPPTRHFERSRPTFCGRPRPHRHFERSRPIFSSAFAPANASACAKRNLSSSLPLFLSSSLPLFLSSSLPLFLSSSLPLFLSSSLPLFLSSSLPLFLSSSLPLFLSSSLPRPSFLSNVRNLSSLRAPWPDLPSL